MAIDMQDEFEQELDEKDTADLDQYGVWVKAGPEDVADVAEPEENIHLQDLDTGGLDKPEEDNLPEIEEDISFDDLTPDEGMDEGPLLTEEEEELLGSLEEEEIPTEETVFKDLSSSDGDSDEQLIEIPLDFADDESPETVSGDELSVEEYGDIGPAGDDSLGGLPDFEEDTLPTADEEVTNLDLGDIEQSDFGEELPELELTDDAAMSRADTSGPVDGSSVDEGSTSILLKIEQELLSIKSELSSLKSELSTLKSGEGSVERDSEEAHGFFEEEEDETIALTGDELDNILNTAEITEELGEATEPVEEVAAEVTTAEDSDETLTDDELDNILHTADITEEVIDVEEETETESFDLLPSEDELSIDAPGEEEEEIAFEVSEEAAPVEGNELIDEIEVEIPDAGDIVPEDIDLKIEETLQEEEELDLITEHEEAIKDEELPEVEEPFEELELEDIVSTDDEGEAAIESAVEEIALEEAAADTELELDTDSVLPDIEELIEEPLGTPIEDIIEEPADEAIEELLEEPIEDIADSIEEEPIDEISIGDDLVEEPLEELSEELLEAPVEEPSLDAVEELDLEEIEDAPEELALEPEELPEELPEEPVIEVPEEAAELDIPTDGETTFATIPGDLKTELKSVLSYMDQLLEALPEEKIQEFARSEHFEVYKKLFEELELNV